MGRRVRLGPPVEPHVRAVRRSVGHAGGCRHGHRSGCASGRWCWRCPPARAARRPAGRRRSTGCRRPRRARPRARRGQLWRVLLFDEPASDDKARRRALDAGIELLVPMLEGGPVPQLGGRRTTRPACSSRAPIWIAGVTQYTAGPRRVARHGLEGLALVGEDAWSPATVRRRSPRADWRPGRLDVALVGGTHPDRRRARSGRRDLVHPRDRPGRDGERTRSAGQALALSGGAGRRSRSVKASSLTPSRRSRASRSSASSTLGTCPAGPTSTRGSPRPCRSNHSPVDGGGTPCGRCGTRSRAGRRACATRDRLMITSGSSSART